MATGIWATRPLGEVATLQRGFDLAARVRRRGKVPVVSSSGLTGSHDEAMVHAPGVVTGRYGTVGEVFYLEEDFWPLNTTLWVSDFHGNDPLFISYLLREVDFASHKGKSGVPGVNRNDLHKLRITLPRDVDEQRAIADALADADGLIAAIDRAIAKKEAIKQAIVRQLLRHNQGLVFGRELPVRPLDAIAIQIQDGTHFSPKPGGHDRKYITSRNIGAGYLRLDTVETISEAEHEKIYKRCSVRFGDLLLTKDGANTGNAAISIFHEEVSLLSSVAFIRVDPRQAVTEYVLQYLLSPSGQRQIADAMAGNAITRLTLAKIRALKIPVPAIEEQAVVARVVGDIDTEIEALKRRLDKAEAIKHGMAQQLLTGRIRLPVLEEVAA